MIYLYPILDSDNNVIDSNNLKLHPRMKDFYKFFKYNGKIIDLFDYNKNYLKIYSRDILGEIKNKSGAWKEKLPEGISEMIIKNKMFGYDK